MGAEGKRRRSSQHLSSVAEHKHSHHHGARRGAGLVHGRPADHDDPALPLLFRFFSQTTRNAQRVTVPTWWASLGGTRSQPERQLPEIVGYLGGRALNREVASEKKFECVRKPTRSSSRRPGAGAANRREREIASS